MDTFGRRIEILLPKELEVDSFWELLEQVWKDAVKAFAANRESTRRWVATGSTADNRSFERDSVIELRKAFELNRALPRSIDLYEFAGGDAGDISLVRVWAWYGSGRPSFKIGVSGPSRIAVERLSNELAEIMSSSRKIPTLAPRAEIVVEDLVVSSTDDGNRQASVTRVGNQDEGFFTRARSFIKEHAAGFILSVLASLVAAAIWLWAGFGQ